MRIDQAKAIAMWDLLASMGYEPQRNDKDEWWYVSPFRHETEASFKVTRDGKAWFDHGLGKGGNILDFVMQHQRTDIRGSLRFMDSLSIQRTQTACEVVASSTQSTQQELWNSAQTSPERHTEPNESDDTFTITKIQSLQNRALIEYLKRRAIEAETVQPWVQEMYYRRNEKPYFALCFENDSEGYELRNPYFKGVIGTKDITTIAAAREGDRKAVAVYEGFIDFLSSLMMTGRPPSMPVIVLNSVAMQAKAIAAIRQMESVEIVHLYLDRDVSGQEVAVRFREQLTDMTVIDQSPSYDGYKDFNDWLVAKQKAPARAA